MKPVFTADEKWCLYINIKRSPPWVDEAKQREPQPRADFHPLKNGRRKNRRKGSELRHDTIAARPTLLVHSLQEWPARSYSTLDTLSNAFQGKPGDDEDDLDRWLSKFFESIPV
ncbi:hypothetical protein Y032_0473g2106 [Ancylostoma ceylanicum]|uniref:Uncharacterized protein n=1 Tax=Ancylostoma ceylanicum TaxID=53326 RepID=A0A016WWA6_9BILA|nr:hypothetical protein Y032_0473g2106 [Ancylostoma ceylanicum]